MECLSFVWIYEQRVQLDGNAKEQTDTNKTNKLRNWAFKIWNVPLSCQKIISCFSEGTDWTRRLKLKECTQPPLNQLYKPVEPQRELWNAAAAAVTSRILLFKLVPIFICPLHTVFQSLHFQLAAFPLQLRSSFRQLSLTHFSLVQLSSVWFSAGSQWDFLYVQQPERVQSHSQKC